MQAHQRHAPVLKHADVVVAQAERMIHRPQPSRQRVRVRSDRPLWGTIHHRIVEHGRGDYNLRATAGMYGLCVIERKDGRESRPSPVPGGRNLAGDYVVVTLRAFTSLCARSQCNVCCTDPCGSFARVMMSRDSTPAGLAS